MKVEINGLTVENGTGKVELTFEEARALYGKLKELFGSEGAANPPVLDKWPAFPAWPPGTPLVPCPAYPPVVVPDPDDRRTRDPFPGFPGFPIVTCRTRELPETTA